MVESEVYPHGDNSFLFKLHNAYQTFNTMMLLLCKSIQYGTYLQAVDILGCCLHSFNING